MKEIQSPCISTIHAETCILLQKRTEEKLVDQGAEKYRKKWIKKRIERSWVIICFLQEIKWLWGNCLSGQNEMKTGGIILST